MKSREVRRHPHSTYLLEYKIQGGRPGASNQFMSCVALRDLISNNERSCTHVACGMMNCVEFPFADLSTAWKRSKSRLVS